MALVIAHPDYWRGDRTKDPVYVGPFGSDKAADEFFHQVVLRFFRVYKWGPVPQGAEVLSPERFLERLKASWSLKSQDER